MPNPTLTWEQSAISILTTPGDPVEMAAALAALVTASSDWVVDTGGDGITDTWVEIAGAGAGPNPTARVLCGFNPTSGLQAPRVQNFGIEHGSGIGTNDDFWVGYAPDDGRVDGNPWDISQLALYIDRWTGMMLCGINSTALPLDRVKMWSTEETLIVMYGSSPSAWHGFIAGATIVPTREVDGEADGRVRGLWCQYAALSSIFWAGSAPPFNDNSLSSNAGAKAVIFDPSTPGATDLIKPITTLFQTIYTTSMISGDDQGEVHRAPVLVSDDIAASGGPGSAVASYSPLSPRAFGQFPIHVVFGVWRQMRQGPDRVSDLAVTDPPPPINVVTYTLSYSPTVAGDTIYLDNA